MADKGKGKDKKKGKSGGGRTTALAGLLAVVAVVAAWLSNCIPGFGIGDSGSAEGEAEADKSETKKEAEETTPTPPPTEEPPPPEEPPVVEQAPAKTLAVMVSVEGCVVPGSAGASAPVDCASLCEQAELFEGIDDAVLEVDGASQGSVMAVSDCLKAKGIDKVAIRRE